MSERGGLLAKIATFELFVRGLRGGYNTKPLVSYPIVYATEPLMMDDAPIRHMLLIFFGVILFLCGCQRAPSKPKAPSGILPRLEFIGPKRNSGPTIIFVHGFGGNGEDTWLNQEANNSFLTLAANDPDLAGATIASYWYRTAPFKSALNIEEHARNMVEVLKHHQLENRPLVFVAHSMGGLLVRQLLLLEPNGFGTHVQLIVFYGTPFGGSEVAELASMVMDNPDVKQMLSTKAEHDWLDEQQSRWVESKVLRNIPRYSAYETSSIEEWRVVDEESSGRGATRKILAIEGTHSDLCKPASAESQSYILFKNAYRETAMELNTQGAKAWPTEDECRRLIAENGGTRAQVLRIDGPRAKESNRDVELTINNGSIRPVCLLFCDGAALYPDQARNDGHFPTPFYCTPVIDGSTRRAAKYFARAQGPTTGWYLVFLRFRDDSGAIVDRPQGLFDLYSSLDPFINISHTIDPNDPLKASISEHVPAEDAP